MPDMKRICIVGSGNWGSVIAKIIGNNVRDNDAFETEVMMYVYEEMIDGKKLTEIINTTHENIKYLPGCVIPDNVRAHADILECAKDADILVFVLPHQFIRGICKTLQGKLKPGVIGVSLIKGLDISEKGLDLISNVLRKELSMDCAVLMGANIAPEVARENYCEATIGCKNLSMGRVLKDMFQTPYFRIVVVKDEETVELCGALKEVLYIVALIADGMGLIANTKAAIVRLGFLELIRICQMLCPRTYRVTMTSNVVAVGAGFVEGLNFGDNTKAAVIRLGLMEMVKFIEEFYQKAKIDTFLESCGVADLVTTCYSGRNMKVARAFVNSGKTIEDLEREMLNGQKLQGPPTAAEVNVMLKQKNLEARFPLFTAVHKICVGEMKPEEFIDCLKNHPEHM